MIVVSLFDVSGEMVKPWAEAGYECHLFDMQHEGQTSEKYGDGQIWKHQADLTSATPVRWVIEEHCKGDGKAVAFVSAFPPCTHLAVSGARWFKGKGLRALQESIGYFATAAEVIDGTGAPGFMENPMSTISTYFREPDFKFHPAQYQGYTSEFADYTKETWLWAFNGFVMPPMSMEPDLFHEPDKTYIHHQPPGEERANIRSKTPPGFPEAVFQANRPKEAA